ncbi:MAG: hypothetical protein GSR86_02930 [Desulfurococcales archaeon]|nr:hypothetical protein [Desulfurococcales archaeon]
MEEAVVEALKRCSPCSFEDLVRELGGVEDLWELRRVLAGLVRRGVIRKVPDQGRRKVLYALADSR